MVTVYCSLYILSVQQSCEPFEAAEACLNNIENPFFCIKENKCLPLQRSVGSGCSRITVYSENFIKIMNALCGQNAVTDCYRRW